MESIGWEIDKLDNNYIYSRKVLGRKIFKIPRFNSDLDLKKLDKWLKGQKTLFAKLEPDLFFPEKDFNSAFSILHSQVDNWSLAPSKTRVIGLSKPTTDLLMSMEKDTRYNIRLGIKKGVKVVENDHFNEFVTLYKETSKRAKFWMGSTKELEARWVVFHKNKKAKLFTAYLNKQPLASAMVFYWEKSAYYLHAASSSTHREVMAPYLLLWEIIKDSKKNGFKTLDLEGIYDPRMPSTKNWKGFTLFKKGFGGEEVTSVGSFSKAYNPIVKVILKLGNII